MILFSRSALPVYKLSVVKSVRFTHENFLFVRVRFPPTVVNLPSCSIKTDPYSDQSRSRPFAFRPGQEERAASRAAVDKEGGLRTTAAILTTRESHTTTPISHPNQPQPTNQLLDCRRSGASRRRQFVKRKQAKYPIREPIPDLGAKKERL